MAIAEVRAESDSAVTGDRTQRRLGAMRDLLGMLREGVISIAVLLFVGFMIMSPRSVGRMLEQPGIQSVKLPWIEVEAALKENSEQLVSAKTELEAAETALQTTHRELSAARERVNRLAASSRMEPGASAELRDLNTRLSTSAGTITNSATRVEKASNKLDGTLERQRELTLKVAAVHRAGSLD